MKIRTIIYYLSTAILLFGCKEEAIPSAGDASHVIELTEVKAEIVGNDVNTRAATQYLEENISRYQFVPNDQMTFTQIHRTEHRLKTFSYKDIGFKCNSSSAWERDKTTGVAGEGESQVKAPARIYWSDASNGHTFIGYSLPKDNASFDWKKSAYYYDADGTKHEYDTYYGAIGDPTNASDTIDYSAETQTESYTTTDADKHDVTTTIKYSPAMRNEDLLLTYDNNLKADNSVANIKFYHALSSIRVIVNISGFYGTETDAYSVVSNMKLLEQPTIYRWNQSGYAAQALISKNEQTALDELWKTSEPKYDQRKDIKLWTMTPEGTGTGASKKFTFYGITVPQDESFFATFKDKDLKLTFDVTYPDPMRNNPTEYTVTKKYSATISHTNKFVYFYPGKCTTIHLSLNHKDETMTIGASYMDWQYVETPDEGNLKKKTTFLESTDRNRITIAKDNGATEDDATWLYNKNKNQTGTAEDIVDIYGNNGNSPSSPYTISTADQLLSFAYEVKEGRSFAGKYVKLDADITLQKTFELTTDDKGKVVINDKLVEWIGIGNETNSFEGFFLGNGRHINYLYGKPFFNSIGTTAVIDKVNFNDAIQVTGSGVLADVNNGLICGCNVEGDVMQSSGTKDSYCGSFVGENKSFIIACTHVGEVAGYGYVGGLVGHNVGAIIASYHSGIVKYATSDASKQSNIGGSTGLKDDTKSMIFSCYQNKDFIEHTPNLLPCRAAWPLTTAQMQSSDFVDSENELIDATSTTDGYKSFLIDTDGVDLATKHYSLNYAIMKFVMWLNNQWNTNEADGSSTKGTEWTIDTKCRTFTRSQVYWIKEHYGSHENRYHSFQYSPATYPKLN